jgi:hypothetical protein
MTTELFSYKDFKLIEERECDDDRYYYYYYVLKNNKYTKHRVDISYNVITKYHFIKLVEMGFPTRKSIPNKKGPLKCSDIDFLWQAHVNKIADNILLGG